MILNQMKKNKMTYLKWKLQRTFFSNTYLLKTIAKHCLTVVVWVTSEIRDDAGNQSYFNFFPMSVYCINCLCFKAKIIFILGSFSLFSVVQFPNDECTTTESSVKGTCKSADECGSTKGVSSGNCASGFGVCCYNRYYYICWVSSHLMGYISLLS